MCRLVSKMWVVCGLVALWVCCAAFGMQASDMNFDRSGQHPFIKKHSHTRLSKKTDPPFLGSAKHAMTMRSMAPQYESDPQITEFSGQRILRYHRRENGIPCEDAYLVVYERDGYPARSFVKGEEPISNHEPLISREEALEKAKEVARFDEGMDKDETNSQDDQLIYRLNPATGAFHLTHAFLFYVQRFSEYVHVKMDAITGEVVEYDLARLHEDHGDASEEVELGAVLPVYHPLSEEDNFALTHLKAIAHIDGVQETYAIDESAMLPVPAESDSVELIFENEQFRIVSNQAPEDLLKSPSYRHVFDPLDLISWQHDVSELISESVLAPFIRLQAAYGDVSATIESPISSGSLSAIVDYDGGKNCNAYFSPEITSAGDIIRPAHIVFYSEDNQACTAPAQNPSIILHELGHYLDHQSFGITDAATSEGIGDVLSMLFLRSPIIGDHFRLNTPNHFVRDLRTDHIYPRDKGAIHFEGQILGSTLWDLAKAWQSIYPEDWVYAKLKELFIKSLYLTSHQLDMHDAMIEVLDVSPDDADWDYLQCSLNDVFSKHGLASREEACEQGQPMLGLTFSPHVTPIPSGSTISVSAYAFNPKQSLLTDGQFKLSLWEDDQLISKQTQVIDLIAGDNTLTDLFSIELPSNVIPEHRYFLRLAYTDRKTSFVSAEKELFIDRDFGSAIENTTTPNLRLIKGKNTLPLTLPSDGFINGPLHIKLKLSTRDDKERLRIYLESHDGAREELAFHPTSLNKINDVWLEAPHRFQGRPLSDLGTMVIYDDEPYPSGVVLERIEIKLNTALPLH